MSWHVIWNGITRMYLFIAFKLLRFYTQAKYHTSEDRIDLVVQTADYVYIMEFKLEGMAEKAMRQINEKHYAQPFVSDTRKLFKISVNFSNTIQDIEKWLVEELKKSGTKPAIFSNPLSGQNRLIMYSSILM